MQESKEIIVAIDPGCLRSAILLWNGSEVMDKSILDNQEVLRRIAGFEDELKSVPSRLLIEKVESYGMPVGREVFETVFWSGRFVQAWSERYNDRVFMIPRREIKLHHCNSARAKDPNIRAALLDKYGTTITKGIHKDAWAAFALASYYTEKEDQNG